MSKKRIEEVISETLRGDAQKNALDFITYLRANEIEIPLDGPDNNFWDATYKGEGMCVINIQIHDGHSSFDTFIQKLPETWANWPDGKKGDEYVDFPVDERTKEIVWANVRPHDSTCYGECSPGSRKRILGREFDNLCKCALGIYNPDTETVDCMKKIMGGLKSDILKNI